MGRGVLSGRFPGPIRGRSSDRRSDRNQRYTLTASHRIGARAFRELRQQFTEPPGNRGVDVGGTEREGRQRDNTRTRRNRCRYRIHRSQLKNLDRSFRDTWLHLQFCQSIDTISERGRHALRLGRIILLGRALSHWHSGSGDHLAPHLNTSQFGCRPALAGGLCYLPSGVRTPIQASRTC